MKFALHPFDPVIFEDSEVLILGSFPSLKSFEYGFYYAHPKNQFWRILSDIYCMPIDTDEAKINLLKKSKIAIWDSVKSCERLNSSDSNLANMEPNDIRQLLGEYPEIKRIFFTGRSAEKLYKKHFSDVSIPNALLPSPSPAYAAMPYAKKLSIWREMLRY